LLHPFANKAIKKNPHTSPKRKKYLPFQLHVSIIPLALKIFYVLHYLWPFWTWVNDKGCE